MAPAKVDLCPSTVCLCTDFSEEQEELQGWEPGRCAPPPPQHRARLGRTLRAGLRFPQKMTGCIWPMWVMEPLKHSSTEHGHDHLSLQKN